MATRVAQARDVALNEMNFRGVSINTAETAITLVPSDSGIIFIQHYASATTYTLPAVADCAGKMFFFANTNTTASTVVQSVAADILGVETAGAANTVLTSAEIGNFMWIVSNGTNFYVIAGFPGTVWTVTS